MGSVRKRNEEDHPKARLFFTVDTIHVLFKFIMSDIAHIDDKFALMQVLQQMDYKYIQDKNLEQSIKLRTLRVLTERVVKGLKDPNILKIEIFNEFPAGNVVLDELKFPDMGDISETEIDYMARFIEEKLQYLEVYKRKDALLNLINRFDKNMDFNVSYGELFEELRIKLSDLLIATSARHRSETILSEFSFSDTKCEQLLNYMLERANAPTAILQTGIQELNKMLSPGFQPGRIYTIVGGSGKFKSGTLLNLTDQIRRYNPQVPGYENGKRKCILFCTLENSIEETIERMFDMYSDIDDEFRDMTMDSLKQKLLDGAQLNFSMDEEGNPSNGLDVVFVYRKNLEMNPTAIDILIKTLRGKGKQVICTVIDYAKRIGADDAFSVGDKERLASVMKSLKNLAQDHQIPIITAMQLNRAGVAVIDDATRDGKVDVARFVGSTHIGNAWEIMEDNDMVILINLEAIKQTDQLFLTFKLLKRRGKKAKGALDYFNHPFYNSKNIRLAPDIGQNKLSLESLGNNPVVDVNEDQYLKLSDNHHQHAYSNLSGKRKKPSIQLYTSNEQGTAAMLNI